MRARPGGNFSFMERRAWLEQAADGERDLLVIGGGITGAGVAREAALRGLSVVLVEQGDFASGTSSRSSKLIHGGIRYLAQGDVALVREAARERAILRAIAPHLARPMEVWIPAPSLPARMKLAAGLWTFSRLAGNGSDAEYRTVDRQEALRGEPLLRSDRVGAGAVAFREYATNDARLTLETLKSAAAAGARVANYAAVTAVCLDGGRVKASVFDRCENRALEIRARCMVNAAGPWFDSVASLVDASSGPSMQLTRGIHVAVRREVFPIEHLVILRAADGRSTFVVPAGSHIYIGTTDTHYEGDVLEPGLSHADVRYLLESIANTFTRVPTAADVVGAWSGVRPLLRQDGKQPSEISRRDEVRAGPGPVVAVAGGKLTTYRKMAERVVEAVLPVLGSGKVGAAGESGTRPLSGGSAADQEMARIEAPRLDDSRLDDRLWATYGVAARHIVDEITATPALSARMGNLAELSAAEVDHAVFHEMALTLDDVLRRRSRSGIFEIEEACGAAPEVASRLATLLGWDAERANGEVAKFSAARIAELSTARGVANREKTA